MRRTKRPLHCSDMFRVAYRKMQKLSGLTLIIAVVTIVILHQKQAVYYEEISYVKPDLQEWTYMYGLRDASTHQTSSHSNWIGIHFQKGHRNYT